MPIASALRVMLGSCRHSVLSMSAGRRVLRGRHHVTVIVRRMVRRGACCRPGGGMVLGCRATCLSPAYGDHARCDISLGTEHRNCPAWSDRSRIDESEQSCKLSSRAKRSTETPLGEGSAKHHSHSRQCPKSTRSIISRFELVPAVGTGAASDHRSHGIAADSRGLGRRPVGSIRRRTRRRVSVSTLPARFPAST
jgi:hypothetical protein